MMLSAGYIIVSIDYRLAPESKLPSLIEDVVAACAWVRRKGPGLFNADVERLAVAGGSAGGYLALAAACHVEPMPTVLASFYGYCDLDVDYKQSVQMAEALESVNVPHQLIILDGADHGFRGIETERIEQAHRKAMAFVRHRMED